MEAVTPIAHAKLALLCIITNTAAAVSGITTIYSAGDPPFMLDTRVGHACRVTANLNTTNHDMLFADFYDGDNATIIELGSCDSA